MKSIPNSKKAKARARRMEYIKNVVIPSIVSFVLVMSVLAMFGFFK